MTSEISARSNIILLLGGNTVSHDMGKLHIKTLGQKREGEEKEAE